MKAFLLAAAATVVITALAAPAFAGAPVTLRMDTTDADGRVKVSVTASKDICFRFAYLGSGSTAPVTSAGDCVRLR